MTTILESPARESNDRPGDLPVGKPLILVIDDERVVREALAEILEDEGYEVLTARDGRDGLAVYSRRCEDVSLVLLDMQMPVMGGPETFSRLREHNAHVKVVVTSGYAEAETMGRFAGSSPDSPLPGFLQKPYDIDALLATVRRML